MHIPISSGQPAGLSLNPSFQSRNLRRQQKGCHVMNHKMRPYQIVILIGLSAAVIGAYVSLVRMVASRVRYEDPPRAVEVSSPADGTLVQMGNAIAIDLRVLGADVSRVECWVDELPIFTASRSLPAGAEPWTVSGNWTMGWAGLHQLWARAITPRGEMVTSEAITLGGVPAAEIVFSSNREGRYAIYRAHLDGTGLERLFAGQGDSREPAVNPFGEVLLTEVLSGQHSGLWVVPPDSAHPRVLREDVANLRRPAWSPDGQWIAFVSDRSGSDQVWVAAGDGSDARPLTQKWAAADQPGWSPTGGQLVFTARQDGNWDIFRIDMAGDSPVALTSSPAVDWQPAWSPVSDQIAFASNRNGEFQIFLMDANGNPPRQLTDLAGGAEQPRWSPDGAWIVFVGYAGKGEGLNARELFLMRSDGRDIMRLTDNAFDDTEPAWEPDGSLLSPRGNAPASGDFIASYYAGPAHAGQPLLQRDESVIGYDWGLGSPALGLPADYFSVRWEGTLEVPEEGDYFFELLCDDGARVWLDGGLLLDEWDTQGLHEAGVPAHLSAGAHALRVDYYEGEGSARIRLTWKRVP